MQHQWFPHPRSIKWFPSHGRSDLAIIEEATSGVGRYALSDYFVLCAIQARFGATVDADAPAGGATLTLFNDTHYRTNIAAIDASTTELVHGVYWIQEWANCGVTRDRMNFRAAPHRFFGDLIFEPGDQAMLNWTNPEGDGTLSWTLRVGLAPVPPDIAAQLIEQQGEQPATPPERLPPRSQRGN